MGHTEDTPPEGLHRNRVIFAVILLTLIATIVGLAYWGGRDGLEKRLNRNQDEAAQKVKEIHAACVRYQAEKGKWPESIRDMLEPDRDGKPFLAGGEAALHDPWSRKFQFELRPDASGKPQPVVWTTDPSGQRISFPND